MSVSTREWGLIDNGAPFYLNFDSLAETLEAARRLERRGFLFRGQSNANWDVTSTAERLTEDQRNDAKEKFVRFISWARQSPQLEECSSNIDSLFAIAQHYGMPTYFIDFTADPKVAAFFACNPTDDPAPNQRAAIICLDPQRFREFWTRKNGFGSELLSSTPGAEPPSIIEIDVHNLWRLQAQRGCFLWNPVFGIERFYSFDRLTFPCSRNDPALPPLEAIYPHNESSLEQLLKSFFMNEQLREGNAAVKTAGWKIFRFEGDQRGHDMSAWCSTPVEPTPDWSQAAGWGTWPNEHAAHALRSTPLEVAWSAPPASVAEELLRSITVEFIDQHRDRGIFFTTAAEATTLVARLEACVRRLWNGMRILPFTAEEIRQALETTITEFLAAQRTQAGLATTLSQPNIRLDVEFTHNINAQGAYSRGVVCEDRFVQAHSEGFIRVASQHVGKETLTAIDLIRLRARPWQRFSFSGLRRLMVEDLIPSQLVLRGDDPTEAALKTMIYYSPADVTIFGLP